MTLSVRAMEAKELLLDDLPELRPLSIDLGVGAESTGVLVVLVCREISSVIVPHTDMGGFVVEDSCGVVRVLSGEGVDQQLGELVLLLCSKPLKFACPRESRVRPAEL